VQVEYIPQILILDTHPVQYRAPIYQELSSRMGGRLSVLYSHDQSVKNGFDKEFGVNLSWDVPLLSGYKNKIIGNRLHNKFFLKWISYSALMFHSIWKNRPDVVFLNGIGEIHYFSALLISKILGIPVWLRSETQDRAFSRSYWKNILRYIIYRIIYAAINHFFCIGKLNKEHYLNHKVMQSKISTAKYCTVDRFSHLTDNQKNNIRNEHRNNLKISEESIVIGFSGKLISKKNPQILYEMLSFLSPDIRNKVVLYFVGSGYLYDDLHQLSHMAMREFKVPTFFSGFVNQTLLHAHYLGMDILVLPSQKMGETWGLVVNEALQAGCSVIVSDAVGCYPEFQNLERFRVFDCGDPRSLADSVISLGHFERNFGWASPYLQEYSVNAVVNKIINKLIDHQLSKK
jgi:glycosyltransferase involved in cell wall biosynthesis